MGVYRRSRDYSDNSKQQFYVDSKERRRSSGNNCGEWCRNGSRNESRFENNFFITMMQQIHKTVMNLHLWNKSQRS